MTYTKITTVKSAFKARGIDFEKIPKLSGVPSKYAKGMLALFKLQVIVEAVNNDDKKIPDWEADYNNEDQYKWFPWYYGGDKTGSGFRFGTATSFWAAAAATGGARFALKDKPRAEHMNKYFSELYKDLFLNI